MNEQTQLSTLASSPAAGPQILLRARRTREPRR